MTNRSREERHLLTLRDCSIMDNLVVERLRDTVQISLTWADDILDILIQMDRDVYGLETVLQGYAKAVQKTGPRLLPDIEIMNEQHAEMAAAANLHLVNVKARLRDTMTSMQNQDVIGQAICRAADILGKRAEALAKAADGSDQGFIRSSEIADLHREYVADDDLHRAPTTTSIDRQAA